MRFLGREILLLTAGDWLRTTRAIAESSFLSDKDVPLKHSEDSANKKFDNHGAHHTYVSYLMKLRTMKIAYLESSEKQQHLNIDFKECHFLRKMLEFSECLLQQRGGPFEYTA
jgi:hypothetical protein